jgi:endonuclease/exonuclease/phosphatase family metal-dependent hydrolase
VTSFAFGTYNLRDGGIDGGDDARLRRQLAVLAAARADAWALQECTGFTAHGCAALLAAEQALGMRAFLAASSHDGCDLAVLVRPAPHLAVTGVRHATGPPWWHGVARVTVQPAGMPGGLELASVHLAPSSPALRLIEAEALGLLARARPAIIGGDFNALPAGDPRPAGPAEGRWRRKLDRAPARALVESGFTDAGHLRRDLTPTAGHHGGLAFRCDRICATLPPEAVTGYQVITSLDADSDHRPVLATFDLTRAATASSR